MAWVLLIVTGELAVLVGVLALRVRRLDARVALLLASSDAPWSSHRPPESHPGSPDGRPEPQEFLITRVGEPEPDPVDEPVPAVPGPVFADLLLKESVVQTASLFQGLRRALSAETRNRIRFHMRQEVKRSRRQRRTELREVRREWAARQRAAMPAEESAA